uniref:Uncharacterized protein n=1 Tax=Falco tinnunculus TaxID=100819 RepID=A0A8C4U635_FALTI
MFFFQNEGHTYILSPLSFHKALLNRLRREVSFELFFFQPGLLTASAGTAGSLASRGPPGCRTKGTRLPEHLPRGTPCPDRPAHPRRGAESPGEPPPPPRPSSHPFPTAILGTVQTPTTAGYVGAGLHPRPPRLLRAKATVTAAPPYSRPGPPTAPHLEDVLVDGGPELQQRLLVELAAVDDPHLLEESGLAALTGAQQQDLDQAAHGPPGRLRCRWGGGTRSPRPPQPGSAATACRGRRPPGSPAPLMLRFIGRQACRSTPPSSNWRSRQAGRG